MSAEKRKKILTTAGGIAFAWVVAVWYLGGALGLAGADLWVLRGGLWVLGLAAIAGVAWFALKQLKGAGGGATVRTDDVDAAMAQARAALAAARPAKGASLGTLPMVVVTGTAASAKTSAIVRSALAPELLAGDVARGDAVAPTTGVNVWFAQNTLFVEAGGGVATEPARWSRLVRHVQPRRLGAALAGKPQAARSALVCVSCEELVRPGGAEAVMRDVRALRDRLRELARALGVRLPVYVLFTKLDRVPHFTEYVQHFTRDEAQEVLGATLPLDAGPPGGYAERMSKRVSHTLDRLFQSLAVRRLELLPREHVTEKRSGVYEFPREFRKLAPLMTELLVELTAPSQLHASPFLRGYYFTGVQPVVVTETPGLAAASAPARVAATSKATGVFTPVDIPVAVPSAGAPVQRKVPRWDFLDGVLRDVVLADDGARRLTEGGARVDTLRRGALAAAAVLALVLAGGFTTSWAQNRAFARRTAGLTAAVAAAPRDAQGLPAVATLRALDSLRGQVETLRAWDRDGAPLRYRWGLNSGDALRPRAERAYVAAVETQIVDSARSSVRARLAALPATPSEADDYGVAYDGLKAYLVTTSEPQRATAAFLPGALLARWTAAPLDSARAALAKRQLEFYAEEMRAGRIAARPGDAATVQHARTHLLAFTGIERIYKFMVSEAGRSNPSVSFNARVPGSAGYLVSRYEVPGAFTKGGWNFMETAFKGADRFLLGEPWVLGEGARADIDPAKAIAELRARYRQEFVQHWRAYLASGAVARYGGVKDAARRLGTLAGHQSPLLAFLSLASTNTAVPDTTVSVIFQPAQSIVAPGATDKLVGEGNASYMQALAQLQSAVDQAANAPPGTGEPAAQAAAGQAAQAKLAVRQLAQSFRLDPQGGVDRSVERLLEAPIAHVEPMLRGVGAAEMNARGRDFCAAVRPLLAKYPFTPTSTVPAPVAEVHAMFRPETGSLWQFADELQKVVVRRGDQFVRAQGATSEPNPAFLAFLNRAAIFSDAVYRNGMSFTIKPMLNNDVKQMTVTIDGQTARWQGDRINPGQFSWLGMPNGEARITARMNNQDVAVAAFQGPWAAFQLFHAAASWRSNGATQTAEWDVAGRPRVSLEIVPRGGQAVMRRDYFNGFGCVSQVAR